MHVSVESAFGKPCELPSCLGRGRMRTFYFGAWVGGRGHMLFEREGIEASKVVRNRLPWTLAELDTHLCPPADVLKSHQQPGKVALHFKKDNEPRPSMWTAMAFWDRSEDTRGNSNSVFLFEGVHDFDRMYELAEKVFPNVVCRIPVELELVWMPTCPKCHGHWGNDRKAVNALCPFCLAFRSKESRVAGGNGDVLVTAPPMDDMDDLEDLEEEDD